MKAAISWVSVRPSYWAFPFFFLGCFALSVRVPFCFFFFLGVTSVWATEPATIRACGVAFIRESLTVFRARCFFFMGLLLFMLWCSGIFLAFVFSTRAGHSFCSWVRFGLFFVFLFFFFFFPFYCPGSCYRWPDAWAFWLCGCTFFFFVYRDICSCAPFFCLPFFGLCYFYALVLCFSSGGMGFFFSIPPRCSYFFFFCFFSVFLCFLLFW